AANTIYTDGGTDTITLGAGHTAIDLIGIYAGFPTVATPGTDEQGQTQSIVENNDFAQLGWWGLPTGSTEAGYAGPTVGPTYVGLAHNTGTSADMSTVANFSTGTDAVTFSVHAWGDAHASNGLNFGAGFAFNLSNGFNLFVSLVGPTATVIQQ